MEDSLQHHWAYLRKSGYLVGRDVDESRFTANELSLIDKYGAWMEALERQGLRPLTAAQERFVQVCRGVAQPVTPLELAWKKLNDSPKEQGDAVDVFDIAGGSDDTSPKRWVLCGLCLGSGGGAAVCLRCRGTGWVDDLRARRNPSVGYAERPFRLDLHPRFSTNAAEQASRA